jgi:hypothetical protein
MLLAASERQSFFIIEIPVRVELDCDMNRQGGALMEQ